MLNVQDDWMNWRPTVQVRSFQALKVNIKYIKLHSELSSLDAIDINI